MLQALEVAPLHGRRIRFPRFVDPSIFPGHGSLDITVNNHCQPSGNQTPFHSNGTDQQGGAIYLNKGMRVELMNCSFVGNTASEDACCMRAGPA